MSTGIETGESIRKVSKGDTFSTDEVKKMLGVDDRGMRTLCKKGQIALKKDVHTDRTFFLKDDVDMLKRLNDLQAKTAEIEARKNLNQVAKKLSSVNENIASRSSRSLKAKGDKVAKSTARPIKMLARTQDSAPAGKVENIDADKVAGSDKEMKMLVKNLVISQENVVKRITKVLDEKLDGMDEIVVELIRCKTENEKLQQQVNRLTKENYSMKAKMATYKPVGFGLYLKKEEDSIYL